MASYSPGTLCDTSTVPKFTLPNWTDCPVPISIVPKLAVPISIAPDSVVVAVAS